MEKLKEITIDLSNFPTNDLYHLKYLEACFENKLFFLREKHSNPDKKYKNLAKLDQPADEIVHEVCQQIARELFKLRKSLENYYRNKLNLPKREAFTPKQPEKKEEIVLDNLPEIELEETFEELELLEPNIQANPNFDPIWGNCK